MGFLCTGHGLHGLYLKRQFYTVNESNFSFVNFGPVFVGQKHGRKMVIFLCSVRPCLGRATGANHLK